MIRFLQVNLDLGGKAILQNLSCEFSQHGISFLMGPNGVGKTQMLRLINGLLKPSAGHIQCDKSRRQALLFQSPVLLNRSVEENLRFIVKVRGLKKNEVGIDLALEWADLLAERQQNALLLSGGQKKRLAMAGAYLQDADIYLLDEPSANIDSKANQRLEALILQLLAAGKKIIVTTHDIVRVSRLMQPGRDEILLVNQGQLMLHSKQFKLSDLEPHL